MATNNVEMNSVAASNVKTVNPSEKENCCRGCSSAIIHTFERFFSKLGSVIARRPAVTILISLLICCLFFIGLMEMNSENRPEKLWVSSESDSLKHRDWFSDNYPPEIRTCQTIVQGNNLLSPSGLDKLCKLQEGILNISKNDTKTPNLNWKTKCFSPSTNGICIPMTILNIWGGNCVNIRKLSQQQIVDAVNSPPKALGKIELLLGDITYDSNKNISTAYAARMTYFLKNEEKYDAKQGRRVDTRGNVWEEEFVNLLKNNTQEFSSSRYEILYYTLTSQRSDSGDTVGGDLVLLALGYVLIIIYLAVMLGQFSRISHKIWLAICGIVVIGLSFGVSYGLSSAFQLMISPVHNVLPFLLLGIGVDDIFVIIRTWDNISNQVSKDATIPEKISVMMQHAGVSILVTSFTDICAFLIGATTVLPALRSFCIFAGIGIIAVFILTCTFFVAWLALDSRRESDGRDACCCCIKYNLTVWNPMECSKKDHLQLFFKNVYSKAVLSPPGRIIVLIVFAGLLAGGAYGLSQLKQDFDPDWFLPPDSMTIKFKAADEKFPDGIKAAVYVGKIDYFTEYGKYQKLDDQIRNDKHVINSSIVSWSHTYSSWLMQSKNLSTPRNESEFYTTFNQFMASGDGQKFKADVKFDSGKIKASRIKFSHIKLYGAKEEIKAMDSIQEICKNIKFKGFEAFGYSRFYVGWETNKIISTELIRNVVLAGVVVLLVTLLLLADIPCSFYVLMCMVLTLVNISGYMHFWGLTVDTVTTILLVLAIGLSVDYSAHIAHAFLTSREGNRVERARNALIEIGPAVFHGGFSTFLAFVCLAGAKSYVFSTFFKLFFLVVVFGVFHGLVFLPVVLSFIGSRPYAAMEDLKPPGEVKQEQTEMKSPSSSVNQALDDDLS